MRFNAKVDLNQTEIVQALRQAGATVQSLAAVGKGVPDLLVCFRNKLYLMEYLKLYLRAISNHYQLVSNHYNFLNML